MPVTNRSVTMLVAALCASAALLTESSIQVLGKAVAETFVSSALAEQRPAAGQDLRLEKLASGLQAPLELAVDPRDSTRFFVAEQGGTVRLLGNGRDPGAPPWLDIRDRLVTLEPGFEERGLLGFALHPQFSQNGKLYVSYAAPLRQQAPRAWNYTRRVVEFTADPHGSSPVDIATERTLIALDWPSRKHNGGGLAFGPDGMLYIGLGDGGGAHGIGPKVKWSAFEVQQSQRHWDRLAQDRSVLFGKILRIDVDRGFPGYGIPADNPFVGRDGRDEIYAWGFRNPYRFAFDRDGDGELFVASVAETLWEAVYLVAGPGNFGWPIREGTHCVNRMAPREPLITCSRYGPGGSRIHEPVVEYPNMQVMHPETKIKARGVGTAVVGARLYRGTDIPALVGRLIVADWSADFRKPSGQLFVASPTEQWGALWRLNKLLDLDTRIIGLAEDAAGEILVLTHDGLGPEGNSGGVYRLTAAP